MEILKIIVFTLIALPVLIIGIFYVWPGQDFEPDISADLSIDSPPSPFNTQPNFYILPTNEPADLEAQTTHLFQPTADFRARITKKPFGIYVSPENSPIGEEGFTGWHTGADAEYEDMTGEITVHAISDGVVRSARRANGYGGIVVIEHTINNQSLLAIYGHLDPASLVQENSSVTVGQQIGVLGEGGTDETDGERKHLHFGILADTKLDVRGYVDSVDKLDNWQDPLTFFNF